VLKYQSVLHHRLPDKPSSLPILECSFLPLRLRYDLISNLIINDNCFNDE
jgi:hypothetical protein